MSSHLKSKRALLMTVALCALALLLMMFVGVGSRESAALTPDSKSEYSAVLRPSSGDCRWKFVQYFPSAWESEWTKDLENRKFKVCEFMTGADRGLSALWLDINMEFMKQLEGASFEPIKQMEEVFSRLQYRYACEDDTDPSQGALMEMMIEPLVGNTRDPFTTCDYPSGTPAHLVNRTGWDFVQSKRHLLLGPYAPMRFMMPGKSEWGPWTYSRKNQLTDLSALAVRQHKKVFLFDLGAASYGSWVHATDAGSTKFFVDNFWMRRRITMDAIYAFEYQVYKPRDLWDQVPEEVMPFYHYINVPVENHGKYNPLNILKLLAKPDDYVIFKLDIDTPVLENALMKQIMSDESILSLIDEMAYEHHVHSPELLKWWGKLPKTLTLSDTYEHFLFLRNHGVRMHSWP